jgi:hypothetical protein
LKLEIDLNQNQHALLLEIASRDRTHRSLASIAREFMIDGLMGEVKKCVPAIVRKRSHPWSQPGTTNGGRYE